MGMTGATELKSRTECHTTNFRQFCIVYTLKYKHLEKLKPKQHLSSQHIPVPVQVATAAFRQAGIFEWFLTRGLNL